MPQDLYYRYASHQAEFDQLREERLIRSTNPLGAGKTWYAPTRYDDPLLAQADLALKRPPARRFGPIPADEMPDFDINGPQPVQPAYGQPGGGIEVCTTGRVFIFGCYNLALASGDWEDL
jgi:hypothetical protein